MIVFSQKRLAAMVVNQFRNAKQVALRAAAIAMVCCAYRLHPGSGERRGDTGRTVQRKSPAVTEENSYIASLWRLVTVLLVMRTAVRPSAAFLFLQTLVDAPISISHYFAMRYPFRIRMTA